jgi:hypothetical protein
MISKQIAVKKAWREEVAAYFKVLPRHLIGRTKKTHKTPVSRSPGIDLNQNSSNMEHERVPFFLYFDVLFAFLFSCLNTSSFLFSFPCGSTSLEVHPHTFFTSKCIKTTQNTWTKTNIHALSEIGANDPTDQAAEAHVSDRAVTMIGATRPRRFGDRCSIRVF